MKLRPQDIEPGDELYVPTSLYIDHGEDDRCGGIAVVRRVEHKPVPKNPVNDWFVYFKDLDSGFNLTILLEQQEELEKRYGSAMAHQCPESQPCPNPQKFDPDTFQLLPIKRKEVA